MLARRFVLLPVLFVLAWMAASAPASAIVPKTPSPCIQKGEVPITDRARARIVGIPDSSPCWNPSDPNTGTEVAEAKTYLRSILCKADGDNYGGMGPEGTIKNLNPKFSVCAATFLKAAAAEIPGSIPLREGGSSSVCVREGARTAAKQNEYVSRGVIACKHGAACEHPRGIAIDVNTISDTYYAKLHEMGPTYKVNFYLGAKDKYHFVPKSSDCSTNGYRPEDPTAGMTPITTSPTASWANAMRSFLGQPTPSQTPFFPSQPLPQTQPVINAFETPTPITVPTTSASTSGSGTREESIADKLEKIISDKGTQSTSTTTTVAVVIDGKDVGGIGVGEKPVQESTSTVAGGGTPFQNTFAVQTSDLANQATNSFGGAQNPFLQILENIKRVLLKMLAYLRPFSVKMSEPQPTDIPYGE